MITKQKKLEPKSNLTRFVGLDPAQLAGISGTTKKSRAIQSSIDNLSDEGKGIRR